ncbi:MAG: transglycosylase SLT domain-containing protein [Parasulfuritortus sp.]|jgi:soluble lytic murein transglycosylase-like protein|nr:transglycosylase SLT domain-containing protein [Parasulfuritortus sp.]
MSKLRKLVWLALFCAAPAFAGAQIYEPLSASVQAAMSKSISDQAVETRLTETPAARSWLTEMSRRLAKRLPDQEYRDDLLATIYYEASRAGLDPEMVMGLIEVESGFRKYAVSSVGARGYMQVMPFWVQQIGTPEQDLFHLRTNLRYGCTILRHYLDIEHGDLFRALGRYNGSLGQAGYPDMVLAAWKNHWVRDNDSVGKQAKAGN